MVALMGWRLEHGLPGSAAGFLEDLTLRALRVHVPTGFRV